MMLEALREQVCAANRQLPALGLVTWTSGNVSALDPDSGLVVIKPSGRTFEELTADDMVIVDLDGRVVEGGGNGRGQHPPSRVQRVGCPLVAGPPIDPK